PTMIHYAWNAWDLTWWYAAPVSGLGFHDNSVDFRIDPGPGVDAPPVIAWSPDLGMITFENRARTVASEWTSTLGDNFLRTGGGESIRSPRSPPLGCSSRHPSGRPVWRAWPSPTRICTPRGRSRRRSRGVQIRVGE